MTATYVQASPTQGAGATLRQHPLVVAAVVVLMLIIGVLAITSQPEDGTPFSPANPGPDGARAAAQILGDQGVTVTHADTLSGLEIDDAAHTTLVIASPENLSYDQIEAVLAYPGDIVFLGADYGVVDLLGGPDATASSYIPSQPAAATCDDPDALAAGTVTVTAGVQFPESPQTEQCFTVDGSSAYVVHERGSGAEASTVRIIASAALVTNADLATEGNAALALRALGHHPHVAWYVSSFYDLSMPPWTGGDGDDGDETAAPAVPTTSDLLPPWFMPVLFILGLTVLVAAWWRGRRFGRLVPEPLPVVVPGAEAVKGRARLYRRANAHAHAGASLRAQAAVRIGRRLGVPRTAPADALIDATQRATGRPREHVAALLTGPLPHSNADMMTLIKELDSLESEVHRP